MLHGSLMTLPLPDVMDAFEFIKLPLIAGHIAIKPIDTHLESRNLPPNL